jgi:hypothetical protein
MQSTVDSGLFRGRSIRRCSTGGPPSLDGSTHVRQSQLYVNRRLIVAEPVHLFDDIGSPDRYTRQMTLRSGTKYFVLYVSDDSRDRLLLETG